MPSNKLASFRYRILNDCFRSLAKPSWSLNELVNVVSEQLFANFDIRRKNYDEKAVSIRTIQADLALMRSEPPRGFGAPIKVQRGEYFYENRSFSINEISLSDTDKHNLAEAALLLRQFNDLPHFEAIEQTLLHIECWQDFDGQQQLVRFEANEYQGKSFIAPIYKAIKAQRAILVTYQAFESDVPEQKTVHPYFLKAYRNRWYVFGWDEQLRMIVNLALDRILYVHSLEMKPFRKCEEDLSENTFFQHTVGVTVLRDAPVETIVFKVSPTSAPYILTKPIHHSQKQLSKSTDEGWLVFEIRAIVNYELQAELRRFGAALEVMRPDSLRQSFIEEYTLLLERYKMD